MTMQYQRILNSVPSLAQGLAPVFPIPVQATRNPAATDLGYQIGQLWVNTAANSSYILTSVGNWTLIS